jgi:hypothetical protein
MVDASGVCLDFSADMILADDSEGVDLRFEVDVLAGSQW